MTTTESATSPPSASDCRLPDRWVERIFSHMAASYGTRFADLWGGQDPATVRAFWAKKLGGFAGRGDVIAAAIDALDDQITPPSLPQFLSICRVQARRLPSPHLALPAPPPAEATPLAPVPAEQERPKGFIGRFIRRVW